MHWDPTGPATPDDLRVYLEANAISPTLAASHGVAVACGMVDLPDSLRGKVSLPAVVWPWISPEGGTAYQAQPPRSTVSDGEPKYRFAAGHLNVLNKIVDPLPGRPIIIAEGTKQAFAVASAAPATYGVFGMAGCYGWRSKGGAILDLEVADGRDVLVLLDADAATNADVYTAGEKLAEELKDSFGAKSVKFIRTTGTGKQGVDDVLAALPPDRRERMLFRWINSAKTKPAKVKPTGAAQSDDAVDLNTVNRPAVRVNGDRKTVIDTLTGALVSQLDRRELFNQGGHLTHRRGHELRLVTKAVLPGLVADATITYRETSAGAIEAWPDENTMLAVLDKPHLFSDLRGIVTSPFVREDGTVCTADGYDPATSMFVSLSQDVAGIEVPDQPTDGDIAAAKSLIFDDLFVDFPLEDDTARANALALLLTPFIRSQVDLAPLAVVSARGPGTGKTLFVNLVATVATGSEVRSIGISSPEEEIRKTMFSALLAGETFLLYDEAHDIDSKQLVEKLTSPTVTDRPLGRTEIISVRQQATFCASGNNVLVQADLARRHYRINMFWKGSGEPSSRPLSFYKHENIRQWAADHRRDLVRACLVIVRAWFARGQHAAPGAPGFGSFEQWTHKMAGILHNAGVRGFLRNLEEARSDNDTVTEMWTTHLWAMHAAVGSEWRTSGELLRAMRGDPDMPLPPIDRFDKMSDAANRLIGKGYSSRQGRDFGGVRVEKSPTRHRTRGAEYRLVVGGEMAVEPAVVPPAPAADAPVVPPVPVSEPGPEPTTPVRPGGLPDGLVWSADAEHPGVWNARLPDGWVRPVRDMGARNDRFDEFLSAVPEAVHGSCRKHPDAEHYHPRGGHLATCSECFPGDFDDNAFRP